MQHPVYNDDSFSPSFLNNALIEMENHEDYIDPVNEKIVDEVTNFNKSIEDETIVDKVKFDGWFNSFFFWFIRKVKKWGEFALNLVDFILTPFYLIDMIYKIFT